MNSNGGSSSRFSYPTRTLKNHGVIYAGDDRWRLSPAFDITPSPSRHRVLETGIVRGGSFDASLDIAFEACGFFDLSLDEATQQAAFMARTIVDGWQAALRDEGGSGDELRDYRQAFDHDDIGLACRSSV